MSQDAFLRDYRPDDIEGVFRLMREIYDENVVANSRRHFAWQYDGNPRNPGGRPAIRVVDRDGDVVAMICGIRQRFWLDGTEAEGLWIVDFMARQAGTTQKERLRYGQRLAIEARDTQPVIAGVNRPALNRYWKRILGNQVDICAVPMMMRPLNITALARKKLGSPAIARVAGVVGNAALAVVFRARTHTTRGLRIQPIDRFDDRFDELWARAAPSFTCLSARDAAYLNWRYIEMPDRSYERFAAFRGEELVGWIVLRALTDAGLEKGRIVDAFARRDDVDTWTFLFGESVDRFRELDVDLAHGLGSTHAPIAEAFRRSGFRPNPEHARASQYIAHTKIPGVDLDTFYGDQNWFVTLGDADTDFSKPE